MWSFQVTILRRNVLRDEMGGDCAATDCTLALRVLVVFMRLLGEPQRSLVLQKMLRNEKVRRHFVLPMFGWMNALSGAEGQRVSAQGFVR